MEELKAISSILVIELACGEYGTDHIDTMVKESQNGSNLEFFNNWEALPTLKKLRARNPLSKHLEKHSEHGMQETSEWNQLKVLLSRGYLR